MDNDTFIAVTCTHCQKMYPVCGDDGTTDWAKVFQAIEKIGFGISCYNCRRKVATHG